MRLEQLETVTRDMGMPRFAAKQMAEWIYKKRVSSIDQMTNLSLKQRETLKMFYEVGAESPIHADAPSHSVPALIPQQLHRVSESTFSKEVNDENINVEELEDTLSLDEVEREMIVKALSKHRGKRKDAAHDLNISERTLYRKIKEYGLDK